MSNQPLYHILEERLTHRGFQCLSRKVDVDGLVRFEVFVAHKDGRKAKIIRKSRTDALVSLINDLDMPELTAF